MAQILFEQTSKEVTPHMDYCPHGHEINSSADRDADGWCKQCRKAANIAYRSRQSAALQLALALEANGIPVTRSEPPIDLSALAEVLARGYKTHPTTQLPTEATNVAQGGVRPV